MQNRGRTGCGCIPGEMCCGPATEASRRLRELMQESLKTGEWAEFDSVREWLTEHHFGRTRLKRTGTGGLE